MKRNLSPMLSKLPDISVGPSLTSVGKFDSGFVHLKSMMRETRPVPGCCGKALSEHRPAD